MTPSPNPVFCAVDTSDLGTAISLAESLQGLVGGIKLGLEFFMANGSAGYLQIVSQGLPIFLDLKLHDIPNTVAGAVSSLLSLEPAFLTVHASGGAAMMKSAAETASKAGTKRPKLLAVTVLTSLDQNDLSAVGQGQNASDQVVRLAKLAKESGMDGIVCSPEEIIVLRQALGKDFILMVPGIRPEWAATNDQKRIMTPRHACEAGASYLVIGRPITMADSPAQAARRIAQDLGTRTA